MAKGNRQMSAPARDVKMSSMMRRLLITLALMTIAISTANAQDVQSDLLSRVNNLRISLGLPAYSLNSALNAAASNHARWLARTGIRSHHQEDGTGPRTRAPNAGYSSSWVSENYYFGLRATQADAWKFWLNSAVHYAGLTSPNYDNIGIAMASSAGRNAFVLVFGNSQGRLPASGASASGQGSAAPAPAAPSYVVGVDEVGNIKHEVQPEDTIGEIALIYGYTWDDIPYMLEINSMNVEDIPRMKIGSIFLVPPKDGTFTPAAPTPSSTPSALPGAATPSPEATLAAAIEASSAPTASATKAPALKIQTMPLRARTPEPNMAAATGDPARNLGLPMLLAIAILIQLGIIASAFIMLIRR